MICPEQRDIMRRRHARTVVLRAGLPLLKRIVDRARELLDQNAGGRGRMDASVQALRREFRALQQEFRRAA